MHSTARNSPSREPPPLAAVGRALVVWLALAVIERKLLMIGLLASAPAYTPAPVQKLGMQPEIAGSSMHTPLTLHAWPAVHSPSPLQVTPLLAQVRSSTMLTTALRIAVISALIEPELSMRKNTSACWKLVRKAKVSRVGSGEPW
jgi:hypothetical protein